MAFGSGGQSGFPTSSEYLVRPALEKEKHGVSVGVAAKPLHESDRGRGPAALGVGVKLKDKTGRLMASLVK